MKTTEPTIPVYICTDRQQPNDTIVLRDFNGFSTTIHASLFAANRLEVEAQEFVRIPETLYNHWFKPIREEIQAKMRLWIWHRYKNNIGLFWKHRARILETPELFFAPVPLAVCGVRPLCLGVMIQAWSEHPELFTVSCPDCRASMPIYNLYGLPNAGGYASAVCPDCGRQLLDFTDGQLLSRAKMLNRLCDRYMEDDNISGDLSALEGVIARLENQNRNY